MGVEDSVQVNPVLAVDRADIINSLWQNSTQISPKYLQAWEAYFFYYTDECKTALERRGEYATVRSHQDVIDIAKDLEDGRTKDEVKQKIISRFTQQHDDKTRRTMAEGSVRLVVRLISMVDVGSVRTDRIRSRAPVPWQDEQQNLKTALETNFQAGTSVPKTSQFDRYFNAINIRKFAGLEIQWTDNLADHLRLVDYDTRLCVFYHVTFLRGQNSTIFPDGFLEETLQTLALLFPTGDRKTATWVKREKRKVRDKYLDLALLDCDPIKAEDRRIEKFKYWRDELVTLKELYEQPRPTSIWQFWYDDRNKVQWYTFWIAALVLFLTVFFGLVSSIEGAMQVYKAYHPSN